MLNPFKKRKILKQIYREEKRLIEESEAFQQDATLSEEEREHLQSHVRRMERLLELIRPRRALDWVSILVRIGIATVLFILFMAPPYQYLRNTYLSPDVVNLVSGVGQTIITKYVPITPVAFAPFPSVQKATEGGVRTVAAIEEDASGGMAAGIVAEDRVVSVYWTERQNGMRVLRAQKLDETLRPLFASTTVLGDRDLVAANVVQDPMFEPPLTNGRVAAVSFVEGGRPMALIQKISSDQQTVGSPMIIPLDEPTESPDSIQLFPWGSRWVLLTLLDPIPGGSALKVRRVMMRVLDPSFAVVWKKALATDALRPNFFPSFLPDRVDAGRFYIVVSAAPAIAAEREKKGEEIYAMKFDGNGEPLEYLRITNNGRPHDFWPSSAVAGQGRNELSFFAFHRIAAAGFEPADAPGRPTNAGDALIFVMNEKMELDGSLSFFSQLPTRERSDQLGATHTRITKQGKRLYIAYDLLHTEDPVTGRPVREVQATFVVLK